MIKSVVLLFITGDYLFLKNRIIVKMKHHSEGCFFHGLEITVTKHTCSTKEQAVKIICNNSKCESYKEKTLIFKDSHKCYRKCDNALCRYFKISFEMDHVCTVSEN